MNCIVVDDEPLARKGIELLIEQIPKLKLCGSFSNAIDAWDFMKANKVDILFLDIQMPKVNGMEFIKSNQPKAKIIITTAYPNFAVEAFELEVSDYLVKPIRFERFYKAVNRINLKNNSRIDKLLQEEEDYIFIRTERKYVRTSYQDIDSIQGLKDYVIVHCGSDKHIVATNLKSIMSKLPPAMFTRINKSCIINSHKIKAIDSDYVTIGNKEFPIGDNYKREVSGLLDRWKVLKR